MKVIYLRRLDPSYPLIRMETPLINEDKGEITPAFKVCVRIKPYMESEKLMHFENDSLGLLDRNFLFDEVFEEHSTNECVYKGTIKPLIKQIKAGFNVTCFAYGMTGAGKTHTMFGTGTKGELGIANLVIKDLFVKDSYPGNTKLTEHLLFESRSKVTVSFLEIYNEQVKDLLFE